MLFSPLFQTRDVMEFNRGLIAALDPVLGAKGKTLTLQQATVNVGLK